MAQNREMLRLEADVAALVAGLAGASTPKAAAQGGADSAADIDSFAGATLADKLAAALAEHK
jgi:hypothetical protein